MSVTLSLSLCESEVFLFSEFANIVLFSILISVKCCIVPLMSVLLKTMNRQCIISFYSLFELFPACNCARSISNLWSICFKHNFLSPFPWFHIIFSGSVKEVVDVSRVVLRMYSIIVYLTYPLLLVQLLEVLILMFFQDQ